MRLLQTIFVFGLASGFAAIQPAFSAPWQEGETRESGADTEFFKLPLDESALSDHWKQLTDEQVAQVTLRNMQAIVSATHQYWEDHGSLPPAIVPNPELPEDKRLSGFVLLLPYFEKIPKDILKDEAFGVFARQLSEQIDPGKAWDDPANAAAAKTLVPVLVSPSNGDFHDGEQQAVSHFAFVRGPIGDDTGAFTSDVGVTFTAGEKQISDGSVATLAIGQIHKQFGPWISAGSATSRHIYHVDDAGDEPTFGTRFENAGYFATCDGHVFFLDLKKTAAEDLYSMATYSGGEIVMRDAVRRYQSAEEWQKEQKK